jgi:hypothetical protein
MFVLVVRDRTFKSPSRARLWRIGSRIDTLEFLRVTTHALDPLGTGSRGGYARRVPSGL